MRGFSKMKVMTMQQFLQNPSGKYSASFYRRDLIIGMMKMKYSTLRNSPLCKDKWKYYVFESQDLQDYFGSTSWYEKGHTAKYEDQNNIVLNDYEKQNISINHCLCVNVSSHVHIMRRLA